MRIAAAKRAAVYFGIGIFFAGAAFQESIMGTVFNHPDGGRGSLFFAVYLVAMGCKSLVTGS